MPDEAMGVESFSGIEAAGAAAYSSGPASATVFADVDTELEKSLS